VSGDDDCLNDRFDDNTNDKQNDNKADNKNDNKTDNKENNTNDKLNDNIDDNTNDNINDNNTKNTSINQKNIYETKPPEKTHIYPNNRTVKYIKGYFHICYRWKYEESTNKSGRRDKRCGKVEKNTRKENL
jgi:hypothetical protein